MTAQPVYITRHGTTWHSRRDCNALDDAALTEGPTSEVSPDLADRRRPCLVCAHPGAAEWTVTDDNLGELLNLIDPSKPYVQDLGYGLQWAGLTIRPHKGMPKQRAALGDAIRLKAGRYTVHPAKVV